MQNKRDVLINFNVLIENKNNPNKSHDLISKLNSAISSLNLINQTTRSSFDGSNKQVYFSYTNVSEYFSSFFRTLSFIAFILVLFSSLALVAFVFFVLGYRRTVNKYYSYKYKYKRGESSNEDDSSEFVISKFLVESNNESGVEEVERNKPCQSFKQNRSFKLNLNPKESDYKEVKE